MDLFAKDMMSNPGSGWTAKGRYKVFQSYLNEQRGSLWVNDFGAIIKR